MAIERSENMHQVNARINSDVHLVLSMVAAGRGVSLSALAEKIYMEFVQDQVRQAGGVDEMIAAVDSWSDEQIRGIHAEHDVIISGLNYVMTQQMS